MQLVGMQPPCHLQPRRGPQHSQQPSQQQPSQQLCQQPNQASGSRQQLGIPRPGPVLVSANSVQPQPAPAAAPCRRVAPKGGWYIPVPQPVGCPPAPFEYGVAAPQPAGAPEQPIPNMPSTSACIHSLVATAGGSHLQLPAQQQHARSRGLPAVDWLALMHAPPPATAASNRPGPVFTSRQHAVLHAQIVAFKRLQVRMFWREQAAECFVAASTVSLPFVCE